MQVPNLNLSPFSACLTPEQDLPATATQSVGIHPPRPHTTSHASTSTSFFGPATTSNAKSNLWNDIQELGHDVKDGVLGLKEVWMQHSSKSKGGQCSTFIDDLAEFVDPNYESSKKDTAEFFTFDKIERLLNQWVPLSVDPRSPNSRVRDTAVQDEGREDLVADSSEEKSKRDELEEADPLGSDLSAVQPADQDVFEDISKGLLEHTNRLREKMMDRSRRSGAVTTPARMVRRSAADMQMGSSSSEEGPRTTSNREKMHPIEENAVVVPGGLWSLPSNEERYGISLSQSYTASRSTRSSGSGSMEAYQERSSNAYYCGPEKVDDVLMMRSVSTEDNSYESQASRFSGGVSEENEYHDVNARENVFQEASIGLRRKQQKLKLNIELGREDEDAVVNNAINAMVEVTSPRSLGSDDKYGMIDEETVEVEEEAAAFDPYAETHELSHYRRARQAAPQPYEAPPQDDSRDEESVCLQELDEDNEAVNRHFDTIMSDFEFALDREKKESKTVYDKLKKYQMQKNFVKHSRRGKVKSPPRQEEDDVGSKTSHVTNHTTASFLQSTTMGRKLNHSTPPSPGSLAGSSVDGSREGILDRARQTVTKVNQVIGSISDEEEVKVEKRGVHESHADRRRQLHQPSTFQPPRQQMNHPAPNAVAKPSPVNMPSSSTNEAESTPVAQYKKRLLEQRSRRMHRDLKSSSRESDDGSSGRSFENVEKPMTPELGMKPQESKQPPPSMDVPTLDTLIQAASQDEANLGICSSGMDSFDSSVNWDALAYSESMSVSDHWGSTLNESSSAAAGQVSAKVDILSPVNEQPHPSIDLSNKSNQQPEFKVPSPVDHTALLGRIEEIKKRHSEEMIKIQMESPKAASQLEADAPDDECYNGTMVNPASEEENQPLSPNSMNECSSSTTNSPTHESNIQRRIELMKQEVEKNADNMMVDLDNNELHLNECVGLFKLNSKKFEKVMANTPASTRQSASRFNFDRSPKSAASTKDLMLRNLELEQEMEKIRALSPKSPLSTRSKTYTPANHERSSPLPSPSWRMGSPRSYADSLNRKYGLKVDVPDSTKSPSRWSSRSTLNTREGRTRTRVSDLMEEVKGFLAENDRARERIARDMDALHASEYGRNHMFLHEH